MLHLEAQYSPEEKIPKGQDTSTIQTFSVVLYEVGNGLIWTEKSQKYSDIITYVRTRMSHERRSLHIFIAYAVVLTTCRPPLDGYEIQ